MWVRLDDGFHAHPKIHEAGLEAVGLHAIGLSWVGQFLTDGRLPRATVQQLAGVRFDELTSRLVRVGMWKETDDGFLIHDYLNYNPSRKQVLMLRADRRRAGQAGGKQRAKQVLEQTASKTQAKSCPVPVPVLDPGSEPEKIPPTPPTRRTPLAMLAGFDRFWTAYPRHEKQEAAEKAWRGKACALVVDEILVALAWQRLLPDWLKDGGAFVPHPSSYLNGKRWKDEPPAGTSRTAVGPDGNLPMDLDAYRLETERRRRDGTL